MKKIGFILILSLLMTTVFTYAHSETGHDLSTKNHEHKFEFKFEKNKEKDDKETKKIKIIQSEDEILESNMLKENIDTYIMLMDDEVTVQAICTECGYNGLTLANIYINHDIALLPCPTVMWPTGSSFLYHYKVYRATVCTYCGYQGYSSNDFLYDKVEHECQEPGGGFYWINPDKTHDDGINNHECPCPDCTDVYRRLPDIVDLR